MKIRLSYHKLVKVEKYPSDSLIELPDRCNVRSLISLLEIPKGRQASIVVYVNNEPVWNSTILKDGDSVKLLASVGGG